MILFQQILKACPKNQFHAKTQRAQRNISYFFSVVFFSAIFFSPPSFSQSQGPNNPSNAVSLPAVSASQWQNTSNVFTSNSQYAGAFLGSNPNCPAPNNCYYSTGLQVSGFGFNIPAGAAINGIVVEIQKRALQGSGVYDSTVKVMKNGIPVGTNHLSPIGWTSNTYHTHGATTDLWGTAWTSADFGQTKKIIIE